MKTCTKCNISFSEDKMYCKSCGSPLALESTLNPKDDAQKSVFEDRLKMNPLDIMLLREYSQFLYNAQLFKEAISVLLKIQAINDNDSFAPGLLFKSYMKIDKLHAAAEIGEQLLVRSPHDISLLADLAEIAIKSEKDSNALIYLNQIIEIVPNDKEAWIKKAEIIQKSNDKSNALNAWAKVYEIDTDNILARMYLGIYACETKDYKKTRDLLKSILTKLTKENDKNKVLFYYVYSLIRIDGDIALIQTLIQQLNLNSMLISIVNGTNILYKSMLAELFVFQGNFEMGKGDYNKAISSFSSAYRLETNENYQRLIADAYYKIAKKQISLNETDSAIINIKNALNLFPDNQEYNELNSTLNLVKEKAKRKIFRILILIGVIISLLITAYFSTVYYIQKSAWDKAKTENTYNSFQKYLEDYPTGRYIKSAKELQEDALWNVALKGNTVSLFNNYCLIYPNGKYFTKALELREEVIWQGTVEQNNLTAFKFYLNECSGISVSHERIIRAKIDSVNNIEPSIEKIKSDLIGNRISGWNFDYLKEFISADKISANKSGDHLEYQFKFYLKGDENDNGHECEVMITYMHGDQGWYFIDVKEVYITYKYNAPLNDWLSVRPLSNTKYSILSDGQRYWVKDGSFFGSKYKGGGRDGENYHLNSSQIYIMSREDHPIDITINYTPSN